MNQENNLPLPIYRAEPTEVTLFEQALKTLKVATPRMIELGCAEAEYSHIFWKATGGTNVCLDILPRQIEVAKKYCPDAEFIHGYVGEKVHRGEIEEDSHGAHMLQMDIQGAELQVSEELKEKDLYQFIDYLFIAFHDNQLEVMNNIPSNFNIIFNHPKIQHDGLLLARNPNYEGEVSE